MLAFTKKNFPTILFILISLLVIVIIVSIIIYTSRKKDKFTNAELQNFQIYTFVNSLVYNFLNNLQNKLQNFNSNNPINIKELNKIVSDLLIILRNDINKEINGNNSKNMVAYINNNLDSIKSRIQSIIDKINSSSTILGQQIQINNTTLPNTILPNTTLPNTTIPTTSVGQSSTIISTSSTKKA